MSAAVVARVLPLGKASSSLVSAPASAAWGVYS